MADYTLPEDRAYTAEHVWMQDDADAVRVGISDFAQRQLEEIVYVDLPAVGAKVEAGAEFGTVESMKSVNALYAPCSGTVTEVNAALEATPGLINNDCYEAGWIARIRRSDGATVPLLDAGQYAATLEA